MKDLKFTLKREATITPEVKEAYTLGTLWLDGEKLCETCEDADRHLESGGVKVKGVTAIPRGLYELTMYNSPKHGFVPLLVNVAGFSMVEIHGGNDAEDSLGCILVGLVRRPGGIAHCAPALAKVVELVTEALEAGGRAFIEVM